jgi:dienelactone hydrolase
MPRTALLAKVALLFVASVGRAQSATEPAWREVFYPSGPLQIQAYLYTPDGPGPFPAVIYNHGSRDGYERESRPFPFIGTMLTDAGYLALVSERRGYGKSGGVTWRQEAPAPAQIVSRLQNETDDVLAAVEYLHAQPNVDPKRIGIMGWSFGGVVTMFAVSRSTAFAVAVDQAGGALTWNDNAHMRGGLTEAARKASTPTLFLVARNDRTTSSVTTLADIFAQGGVPYRLVVYDPYTPPGGTSAAVAAGHSVFAERGAAVWRQDVVDFLGRYLGPSQRGMPR